MNNNNNSFAYLLKYILIGDTVNSFYLKNDLFLNLEMFILNIIFCIKKLFRE
jgi:hypothetical protein